MSDFTASQLGNPGGSEQVCSSIPLQNNFELLMQQNDGDDVENETTNENRENVNTTGHCPPITVRNMSVVEINKMLYQLNGDGKFVLRNFKGVVQIRTKCIHIL